MAFAADLSQVGDAEPPGRWLGVTSLLRARAGRRTMGAANIEEFT
jgi:hypothetical protein